MPGHASNKITLGNVGEVFKYHAPNPSQIVSYQQIRKGALELASVILDYCPDCADRSAALRHLRECVMTANASIALSVIEE